MIPLPPIEAGPPYEYHYSFRPEAIAHPHAYMSPLVHPYQHYVPSFNQDQKAQFAQQGPGQRDGRVDHSYDGVPLSIAQSAKETAPLEYKTSYFDYETQQSIFIGVLAILMLLSLIHLSREYYKAFIKKKSSVMQNSSSFLGVIKPMLARQFSDPPNVSLAICRFKSALSHADIRESFVLKSVQTAIDLLPFLVKNCFLDPDSALVLEQNTHSLIIDKNGSLELRPSDDEMSARERYMADHPIVINPVDKVQNMDSSRVESAKCTFNCAFNNAGCMNKVTLKSVSDAIEILPFLVKEGHMEPKQAMLLEQNTGLLIIENGYLEMMPSQDELSEIDEYLATRTVTNPLVETQIPENTEAHHAVNNITTLGHTSFFRMSLGFASNAFNLAAYLAMRMSSSGDEWKFKDLSEVISLLPKLVSDQLIKADDARLIEANITQFAIQGNILVVLPSSEAKKRAANSMSGNDDLFFP